MEDKDITFLKNRTKELQTIIKEAIDSQENVKLKNLFFRPPPQNKYLLELSLFKNFIPSAIKYAVNSVIVEHPSSKDKPLAKDISNSFTSSDFE